VHTVPRATPPLPLQLSFSLVFLFIRPPPGHATGEKFAMSSHSSRRAGRAQAHGVSTELSFMRRGSAHHALDALAAWRMVTVRRMLPIPNSRWVSRSAHVEASRRRARAQRTSSLRPRLGPHGQRGSVVGVVRLLRSCVFIGRPVWAGGSALRGDPSRRTLRAPTDTKPFSICFGSATCHHTAKTPFHCLNCDLTCVIGARG